MAIMSGGGIIVILAQIYNWDGMVRKSLVFCARMLTSALLIIFLLFLFWFLWIVDFLKEPQYSVLLILFILVEVGFAAFIFFDKSWTAEIPVDQTGEFDIIYGFLRKNWNICKWVALGAIILQGLIFLLALIVHAANASAEYDSDDEYINGPRQQRQPLISRQQVPATGVHVAAGSLDSRFMHEKFAVSDSPEAPLVVATPMKVSSFSISSSRLSFA